MGQLATDSDDLVAVPTELRGLVRDCWVSADDYFQARPPPCESVSLPCLLCDQASACGAKSRPS